MGGDLLAPEDTDVLTQRKTSKVQYKKKVFLRSSKNIGTNQ